MPITRFDALPDDARVWVFASDVTLSRDATRVLMAAVDGFLENWNAHGAPLTCARELRDDRFLAIGVDQTTAGASGCSIDGLFRTLRRLEPELNANLLAGGRVYWRDASGAIRAGERAEFAQRAGAHEVDAATPVFDPSVSSAKAWRDEFEGPAGQRWHAALLPKARESD